MYTLKSIATRGTALGAAFALVAAAVVPAASVFADALNPLTERSLMLSSSSPGYTDTDGSGNSADAPNSIGENYAPAGSGPNGKKTGEKFTFKTSSTASIKAFTLQYCTKAAGMCAAPGNNDGDDHDSDRAANGHTASSWDGQKSDFDVVGNFAEAAGIPPSAGEFLVTVDADGDGAGAAAASTGWSLKKENAEDSTDPTTGKNNYLTLENAAGGSIPAGATVTIEFKASESVYITNPGDESFFVKINTYNAVGTTKSDYMPASDAAVVDGGVTVANVMTDSIHITTKVLETMSFSVGTQNRDTVNIGAGQTHGSCDPIQQISNNRLDLGDATAEYSLDTRKAYDVHSYWRLSSNSSGGATVYYSGDTLHNTVGDSIADMPSETASTPGTEQFGLGFVDAGTDTLDGGGPGGTSAATWATNYTTPNSAPFVTLKTGQTDPAVYPAGQLLQDGYDEATGTITGASASPGTAKFKFLKSSLTTPEPIAQENSVVVSCATAKMRYVANIGADTPAGVYTTKINYLAAPQY